MADLVRTARIDRSSSPLLSDHTLKLAVFGTNVSHGCSMTEAEGTIAVEWAESVRLAKAAERLGIEAMVPVARWRGFGGNTNFNHRSFETYTWAAGLAAATEKIMIFSTSHVPTIHPVLAAKQAATIDHISGGRFGLNIVAGWNDTEIAMFGSPQKDHDDRYHIWPRSGSALSNDCGLKKPRLIFRVDIFMFRRRMPNPSRSKIPIRLS